MVIGIACWFLKVLDGSWWLMVVLFGSIFFSFSPWTVFVGSRGSLWFLVVLGGFWWFLVIHQEPQRTIKNQKNTKHFFHFFGPL